MDKNPYTPTTHGSYELNKPYVPESNVTPRGQIVVGLAIVVALLTTLFGAIALQAMATASPGVRLWLDAARLAPLYSGMYVFFAILGPHLLSEFDELEDHTFPPIAPHAWLVALILAGSPLMTVYIVGRGGLPLLVPW